MDRDPQTESLPSAPPAPVPSTGEPSTGEPQTGEPQTGVRASEPVVPSRPLPKRSGGARILNLALGGAVVLAIAGVAFAVGRVTAPTATTAGNLPGGPAGGQFPIPSGFIVQGNGGNRPGGPGGVLAGTMIEGTVESVSDTTLTLKTADGQTIQIALDEGTTYHAQTDASADDVTTGRRVQVRLDLPGQAGGGTPAMSADDITVVP